MIRFSVIGINHGHVYGQVDALLGAGAEFVSFFAQEEELTAPFSARYPQARRARSAAEILEKTTVQLIASAAINSDRAPLGIEAMKHGKDFMVDKPGFTSLEQLAQVRRLQAETGRIYSIFYCERLDHPATVRAGELVRQGAIGKVVQTVGLGPHQSRPETRPAWFFERSRYGGILADIASHQFDQFLYFTGSTCASITAARVANVRHTQYPELQDFGEALLQGDGGSGYIRVDWLTPGGLGTWGDGRLIVLGTEGYIEVRKNCDIGGRPGGNHLFLVDQEGIHYEDCGAIECPYGRQLVYDVVNRAETAMSQAHCFLASELALKAQAMAEGRLQVSGSRSDANYLEPGT
jgi:predicted dehydrogenase